MITKTIISKNSNGQISITSYDDRDNLDDIIQKHITNNGLTLVEVIDGVIEKPESKEHRDCWDFKNGVIEVDSVKVQAKEDAKTQKQTEREAILSKLKISEAELDHILKR